MQILYLWLWKRVFLQEKCQLKRARASQSYTVAKWPQWYTLCPGRCDWKCSLTILKRFVWLARVCSVELCATVLCKLTLVPDYMKPRAWPNQNRLTRKFTNLLLKDLNDWGRDFLLAPFKFEKKKSLFFSCNISWEQNVWIWKNETVQQNIRKGILFSVNILGKCTTNVHDKNISGTANPEMRFPHVQNVLNHDALMGRASIDLETPLNLESMLVFSPCKI